MADTIQTVRWSLGGDDPNSCNHLWPNIDDDALWASIRRCALESQLRDAFQITDPLWYGFWIDSPLSQTQCRLISILLTDLTSGRQDDLPPFLAALNRSLETGEPLYVELVPPGHVDMGWFTIFVHCPRCKAEGPLERWKESYPTRPIRCPICSHSYSPAATHSAERDYAVDSVRCTACHTLHRTKDFSEADIAILEGHHYHREACEEQVWLQRAVAFYQRHPGWQEKIRPPFLSVFQSDDPQVQDAMHREVPFDEIFLPFDDRTTGKDWSDEDRLVVDYAQLHNVSWLSARSRSVRKLIEKFQPLVDSKSVPCPKCGGNLT